MVRGMAASRRPPLQWYDRAVKPVPQVVAALAVLSGLRTAPAEGSSGRIRRAGGSVAFLFAGYISVVPAAAFHEIDFSGWQS
jgi:hypothetical protein